LIPSVEGKIAPLPTDLEPGIIPNLEKDLAPSSVKLSASVKEQSQRAGCAKPGFGADPRAVLPFVGGETEALKRVKHYFFDTNCIARYKETRNGELWAPVL
jgi:deoxyribodipyrimidine photo-lyase